MRLKIPALYFFVLLMTLSLLTERTYALSFSPQEPAKQEQQSPTTEQKNSGEAATEQSPKAETTATNTEKNTEEPHQHHVIINAPADAFEQQQQDIKHYLSEEQINPIMVGEDKYLIATNKHTSAINKGVMVLIPDWQQSIAEPNALSQLQQNMPQHGWTTISLHPPHKPENYPSQAYTTKERSAENSESLTKYGKKFADIMQAVMEQAKSYPGAIIVVAEGSHSAVLLDIYQQRLVDAPSAMVMLSSYMPTLPESDKLAQQLAIADYPIFDLFLKRDHHLVVAHAKKRKDLAKRAMKIYYRQKQLHNQVTGYYPKNSLTKEIISWLSAIGW
jgi:hypothetical protein